MRRLNHQKMLVWKMADELDKSVQNILGKIPKNEFKLKDQIDSASDSIGSNFVEGYYSGSLPEYIRFCRYSRRSCGELQERLRRAFRKGFINFKEYEDCNQQAIRTGFLFDRLIQSLERKKEQEQKDKQIKRQEGKISLFTLLSFSLIALIALFYPLLVKAQNASLYLSPSTGTYTVGNTFSVQVKVNSGGVAINAAESTLVFDPDKLEVVGISKEGSIFTLWIQEPTFSNSLGTINFAGGKPSPGFVGAAGIIINITLRAKTVGTGSVTFASGSVLADDGKGTNILASLGSGSYTFSGQEIAPITPTKPPVTKPPVEVAPPTPTVRVPEAPVISSSTHPDQNKWSKNNNPEFSWDLPSDITDVSFKFDKNPVGIPGNVSDGLFKSKLFKNIEDGIWYFHLKFKNRSGWGKVQSFKIQIDTTPPEPFEIVILDGEKTTNPQPVLNFETRDKTSGLAYYEVKIGGGDIFPVELEKIKQDPFRMPLQAPGKHTIIVKAVDKAGNFTLAIKELEILSIESPKITEYPRTVEAGEIFTIQGTSLPKSLVSIYYQEEEKVVKLVTKANSAGFWEYVFTKPLKEGTYYFWAEAIDERGAVSPASERIIVRVQPPAFLRIGRLAIDFLSTVITILILIAVLIFGLFWSWQKARKYRASLKKETREAEESLKKAMATLREDIEEKLKSLEKVKSSRELTEEEKKIEKELKQNLEIAESYIAKEIKDIEEKLK